LIIENQIILFLIKYFYNKKGFLIERKLIERTINSRGNSNDKVFLTKYEYTYFE